MAYDIPPPKRLPQPGYYYHFKHDPAGPVNNYAYYIYGVGHHTKTIAEPKMHSCKSTGHYTRRRMLTGTADSSISAAAHVF